MAGQGAVSARMPSPPLPISAVPPTAFVALGLHARETDMSFSYAYKSAIAFSRTL
jgi:hypothetical protein